MTKNDYLVAQLNTELADYLQVTTLAHEEVTVECDVRHVKTVLTTLRDSHSFCFDQLIDLCGVDYLYYGQDDWKTETATESGFSRGVATQEHRSAFDKPRFAVVYHLLSTQKNHRLRVKTFTDEAHLIVPSVHDLWKGANWFEREAYDLYGILFEGHPDLRRILTDYGFIGHPFRKDFPVSGHVEMRYDAKLGKVIYAPVEITPRVLVPKVIRHDNRYIANKGGEE
ncbi:MAG: NADH-quinone oxidoreductase subunit C [Legionella sp.]|nr:MAG: NADH-quinone oxidoreductase subunit C [Legionella sp.]PJD97752.1 MAG: NADH-quinone oxidoreductase subunit C [Legionella sp.]